MKKCEITLLIEYDEQIFKNPKLWDWQALADLRGYESVRVINSTDLNWCELCHDYHEDICPKQPTQSSQP